MDYRTNINDYTDQELAGMAEEEAAAQQERQHNLGMFGGNEQALDVYEAAMARMLQAPAAGPRHDRDPATRS